MGRHAPEGKRQAALTPAQEVGQLFSVNWRKVAAVKLNEGMLVVDMVSGTCAAAPARMSHTWRAHLLSQVYVRVTELPHMRQRRAKPVLVMARNQEII